MQKSGQKRPITPNNLTKILKDGEWRRCENEVVLSANEDGILNFHVEGGSDNGEFAYVSQVNDTKINYQSGKLLEGDIILEVQGQKVTGYTQRDVVAWLNHCCKNGNPVVLKTIQSGSVTQDLREFLNTRFQKGSPDHDLQNIIRDNLYLRTVPVTTRDPRDGEVHGVDYTFLSLDEFISLEQSGSLLENGIYEGNHYGTPKPSKELPSSPPQTATTNGGVSWLMPGAHPSSEGKRKRNRSNVEAMSAKDMEPLTALPDSTDQYVGPPGFNPGLNQHLSLPSYSHTTDNHDLSPELGALPSNWEKAYTEKGEIYFIDHNTGTSHWLDPRLSKFQKKSLEECLDDELPYGWEKIEDPQYGTYFIDHVNRRTQYENPVLLAKRGTMDNDVGEGSIEMENNNENYIYRKTNSDTGSQQDAMDTYHPPTGAFEDHFFTRNPAKLKGDRFTTVLVKSSRGLGFTIVGGDENVEEFLQIKSVVPNGPAWLDGKLNTGDVLVYVNETCVLGFTHHDMVTVFQSIAPGETVKLDVCRGYSLPFDPNDPNTEVVTTVAVSAPDPAQYLDETMVDGGICSNSDDMVNTSVKSMPDLFASERLKNMQRPNSTDVLLDCGYNDPPSVPEKPEFLSIVIVKGPMGFGFTIADSAFGQKVKKILDRQRCKNLMEGDILVEINAVNVRRMCHGEVVQVLKECERNQEATVTVQRGSGTPIRVRQPRKPDFGLNAPGVPLYRSKTPTADLYSTQQKEIMPNRPKTPIVDTRGRAKTPVLNQGWTDDKLYKLNFPKNDTELLNNANDTHPTPYFNGYVDDTYCYSAGYPIYGINQQHALKPAPNHTLQRAPFYHDSLVEGYPTVGSPKDRFPAQPKSGNQPIRHPGSFEYVETVVSLMRQETGFGFRIVGGTEESSQVGGMVSIGHIVPGGAADLDGRLCTGDEIVSVDGQSVMSTSHHHVVQLMGKAAVNGSVSIGIRRRIPVQDASGIMCSPPVYPYHVTVTRRQDEGFGFVIISSLNRCGSTIGRIINGSPAERCGKLHVGDHILAVNNMDIVSLHHGDIVNLIKDSGYTVTLTIGPPFMRTDDTSSNTSASQRDDLESAGLDEDQYSGMGPRAPSNYSPRMGERNLLEDNQYHAVELNRGSRGFGFSIRGGKEFQNMPLYVLQIAEAGPAAVNEKLRIGDQIIEINGINTKHMTHAQAIEIIRKGGPSVRLLVRRGEKPPPPPPPVPIGGDY